MSSYDETGRGAMWRPTHGANGTECEACGETIDRCEGGKLYNYADTLLCLPCLQETFAKYESVDYCDNCTRNTPEADKARYFNKCKVYPWGGESLCMECIINEHLQSIDEKDPIDD